MQVQALTCNGREAPRTIQILILQPFLKRYWKKLKLRKTRALLHSCESVDWKTTTNCLFDAKNMDDASHKCIRIHVIWLVKIIYFTMVIHLPWTNSFISFMFKIHEANFRMFILIIILCNYPQGIINYMLRF